MAAARVCHVVVRGVRCRDHLEVKPIDCSSSTCSSISAITASIVMRHQARRGRRRFELQNTISRALSGPAPSTRLQVVEHDVEGHGALGDGARPILVAKVATSMCAGTGGSRNIRSPPGPA